MYTTSFLRIQPYLAHFPSFVSLRLVTALGRFKAFMALTEMQFLVLVESWRLHCWPPLALISSQAEAHTGWSKCNRELLVVCLHPPPLGWLSFDGWWAHWLRDNEGNISRFWQGKRKWWCKVGCFIISAALHSNNPTLMIIWKIYSLFLFHTSPCSSFLRACLLNLWKNNWTL